MIVFGHSHLQFTRADAGRTLVNPGSVGLPFDGDPRAAYALWDGGREFELRRVEYDREGYRAGAQRMSNRSATRRDRRSGGSSSRSDELRPVTANGSSQAAGDLVLGGDMPVRRLGFGAMRITGEGIWGEPRDRDEALRVLRRAVELDVNLIDTADSYGPEVSENLIAEALHPYPDDLVIATKGGPHAAGPGQWGPTPA